MRQIRVMALLVLALAAIAYAGDTVVQVYKCSVCHKVEQYDESGYHAHYCSGTSDKPHAKTIMQHIGEQKIKK